MTTPTTNNPHALPSFRERLKAARTAAGMTQAQAADAISPMLSVRTIQSWEADGAANRAPPEWTHEFIFYRISH